MTQSSIRLPFQFDAALLQEEMNACLDAAWRPHFNDRDYSGNWTSIALYSVSGKADDIMTFGGVYQPTELLARCRYINGIIEKFRCEKQSVRLLNLAAGSVIHEHRDRGLGYSFGEFRVHIPLQTNPLVDFLVDKKRVDMQAGECWYADFDLPHSVNNRSNESRVHLVIDCIRNGWSDELFRQAGYDFSAEKRGPDKETIQRMIAELERMNSETSKAMIAELKSKLDA